MTGNKILQKITALRPFENQDEYPLNDKGLSALFSIASKDFCRYNPIAREWFVYNGKVWEKDPGAIKTSRLAKKFTTSLLIYALNIEGDRAEEYTRYCEFVAKLGSYRTRRTIIEDSKDQFPLYPSDLDKNLHLFNCQNGTYDLKTFTFKPHDPNDLLSQMSNVVYIPTAKSPLFEKFINEVMLSDTPKIDYLQKLLGYTLTGDTRLETCFFLYGATTRNGKSTLVETISYMFGGDSGYALNAAPESLAVKQNKDSRQASGDIARLNNCRFLNVSEPPKRMVLDIGLLKIMLGRDKITARHLHERDFEFTPVFKLFVNMNFLPLITDDTLFASGRLNVITFDRHFKPSEQDKTLKNKLKEQINISGIFNWCIEGLRKFYESGAVPPQIVIKATEEYRNKSDKIGNFISECLEESPRHSIKISDAYVAFQKYCQSNGYGVENKSNFIDEIKGKGIFAASGTVGGITYKNVIKGHKMIHMIDFGEPVKTENKAKDS